MESIEKDELTSAWIVFDQEFIKSYPSAANTNHHSTAQNTNES